MKVYILKACIDYEGYIIKGVFSSEELAQEYLDSMGEDDKIHIDRFTIVEYDVRFNNSDFSLTNRT